METAQNFLRQFTDEVTAESAQQKVAALGTYIEQCLKDMAPVKALVIEVHILKSIGRHIEAWKADDQDKISKAALHIAQQVRTVTSSSWKLSSEMIHPVLYALGNAYLESAEKALKIIGVIKEG